MKLLWEDRAWSDYLYWQTQDKKTLKRINALIKDILRSPYQGIGKPEPLRGKRLVSVDVAGMVAGTKYRGEFEERLRDMLAEIQRAQLVYVEEKGQKKTFKKRGGKS